MSEQRLIDANEIVRVAEHAYNEWNLAMAAADGNRKINHVFKMQELCKTVKAVADSAPTIDPETLPIVQELREKLEEARRDCAVAEKNHAECAEKLANSKLLIHAHWVDLEPELTDDEHAFRCSACLSHDTIHPELMHNAKFCHFCGAKMDEEG